MSGAYPRAGTVQFCKPEALDTRLADRVARLALELPAAIARAIDDLHANLPRSAAVSTLASLVAGDPALHDLG